MARKDTTGEILVLENNFPLLPFPALRKRCQKTGNPYKKINDAKALHELDTQLRLMDANDPVKYDFALFGLGVFEGF